MLISQSSANYFSPPIEQRKSEAEKIRTKYPDRIPVVVERVPNSQIPEIDKRKFLVPNDISVAQFMWIIRKRIQLPSEKAIFLFVNKTIPQSSSTMGQIYTSFKGLLTNDYFSMNTSKSHHLVEMMTHLKLLYYY